MRRVPSFITCIIPKPCHTAAPFLPIPYVQRQNSPWRMTATLPTPPSSQGDPVRDVPTETSMFSKATFEELGVSESIVSALRQNAIAKPTQAQASTIPVILRGLSLQMDYAASVKRFDEENGEIEGMRLLQRPEVPENDIDDVLMIGAETGSGKTLSYLLPYVQLMHNPPTEIKAVILVPSRELCWQVSMFLEQYFEDVPRHMVLSGGNPPDASDVEGVKIVIATPAALLNYFRFHDKPDASDKYIVVDEADMLLAGGFLSDVERILDQPGMKPFARRRNGEERKRNRNRLVFVGATYPHWTGERVKSIVTWMKRRYPGVRTIQTEGIHKPSEQLSSRWIYLRAEEDRVAALVEILHEVEGNEKIMVFFSKAEGAARICELVTTQFNGVYEKFGGVLQLHKLTHWRERARTVELFSSGQTRLLFCTDLASRGLDLGNVTRVVEFDFAMNVVNFLHRIGRTARAGRDGRSDHFYDSVSKPLADAIRLRADGGTTVVEGVFSRNRSFRRKLKKRMAEADSMDDVKIDEMDAVERALYEEEEGDVRGDICS